EAAIALSILLVACEIVRMRRGETTLTQRWPWAVAFAFGLLHGFGFAGALQEVGVPHDRAPLALALFNLGVEAGQLAVLAGVWPVLCWLRTSRELQFRRFVRVANLAIVALGLTWAVERSLGGEPAVASDEAPRVVRETPEPTRSELRHVYRNVERSPLAASICEATQRLPRERRAACAGTQAGPTLEAECTRVLSAALSDGALRVDPVAADSCMTALHERYADCSFASASVLSPPAACTTLWQGQRNDGASCRSSLECQSGLHCHGASGLSEGTCGKPKLAGARCTEIPDPLGAYLPMRDADHRECQGTCRQGRCSGP
ncbi:MAG TPA: HupE/UreJ family protein, partial [Polyangiales bacterium]|nr:HupE/UreJ family protein [Polyangiales bacterium]